MSLEKVEDSIIGNRQFMLAIIHDLEKVYPKVGYTPSKKIESIMYDEGCISVIGYLKRRYLNG